ncbi:MAG: sigma-70 family RNA polymerase sigma factor [Planctomycetes bacterium]|nr:sigma-70 family RNA polymerase sigma factor [Planctomycetota bacterium]
MDRERPIELESLMRRQGWLAALARSLVRDAAAADDLVQETWLVALERAPREGSTTRAWLRTVMRNLRRDRWREETSRGAREQRVARPEELDEHSAERLDGAELVVRTVRELYEPYRTVVLLRYFDELAPAEIAERLGVPVATVHTRLARALDRLREKLDRRAGGRENWLACVVPLAKGATVAGGLLMKTQAKVGLVAALLLLVAGGGWWFARPTASPGALAGSAHSSTSLAPETSTQSPPVVASASAVEANHPAAGDDSASRSVAAARPEVVVRGRVVDERRRPAAGATVELTLGDEAPRATISGDDGSFEFALAIRPTSGARATFWARLGDDRAGARATWIPGREPQGWPGNAPPIPVESEVVVAPIPLLPATALDVSVLEGGIPAAGAEVVAHLDPDYPGIARGITNEAGVFRLPAIPAGLVRIEARRGSAWLQRAAHLPDEPRLTLALVPQREVELVVEDESTGAPLAGATIEGTEPTQSSARRALALDYRMRDSQLRRAELTRVTDASGRARLAWPTGSVGFLRVRCDGYRPFPNDEQGDARLESITDELRIALSPLGGRTVAWPIADGEVAAPAEGERVRLQFEPGTRSQSAPGPVSGVVRGGEIIVGRVDGRSSFIARTNEGAAARLSVEEAADRGEPAVFRRARTLSVRVLDADGEPVANAAVQPRSPGNQALAPWTMTDASGLATCSDLFGEQVRVQVVAPGGTDSMRSAGTVDLEHGDASLEVRLAREMHVRVRTRIDGEARLPAEYTFSAGQGSRVLEEFPELGEFVALAAPETLGNSPRVMLSAPGFVRATAPFTTGAGAAQSTIEFELERACSLTDRIVTRPGETAAIALEAWDAGAGRWPNPTTPHPELYGANGPGGVYVFDGLVTGGYRVHDRETGLRSAAVVLTEEARSCEVELDLAANDWVRGRVVGPSVAELAFARVLVEGIDPAPRSEEWLPAYLSPDGYELSNDGAFAFRTPHDRTVTLRAWHPWLKSATDAIDVRGGQRDVVLELEAGDDVRLPVPQLAGCESDRGPFVRIAVYRGSVNDEPVAWIRAPVVDGVARFRGLEAGTWTLWIDPIEDFAPLILTNVEIGSGSTSLEPATFARGSSVRVKVLVNDCEAAPSISITAHATGEPRSTRWLNSRGEAEPVLPGLGVGEYDVRAGVMLQVESRVTRRLVLDGTTDVELTLDLR